MSVQCLNELQVEEVFGHSLASRLWYSYSFSWLDCEACWGWAWEEPLPGESRSTSREGSHAKIVAVEAVSQASTGITLSKSPQVLKFTPWQGLSKLGRRLEAASQFVWDADWSSRLKTYFVHAEHTHTGFNDSPKEKELVLFCCTGPIPTSSAGQVCREAKPGAVETPWGAQLFMCANEKRKQIPLVSFLSCSSSLP